MPYTMEDYRQELKQRVLKELTPEELLAQLTTEERLKGLPVEEILSRFRAEEIVGSLSTAERTVLRRLLDGEQ